MWSEQPGGGLWPSWRCGPGRRNGFGGDAELRLGQCQCEGVTEQRTPPALAVQVWKWACGVMRLEGPCGVPPWGARMACTGGGLPGTKCVAPLREGLGGTDGGGGENEVLRRVRGQGYSLSEKHPRVHWPCTWWGGLLCEQLSEELGPRAACWLTVTFPSTWTPRTWALELSESRWPTLVCPGLSGPLEMWSENPARPPAGPTHTGHLVSTCKFVYIRSNLSCQPGWGAGPAPETPRTWGVWGVPSECHGWGIPRWRCPPYT